MNCTKKSYGPEHHTIQYETAVTVTVVYSYRSDDGVVLASTPPDGFGKEQHVSEEEHMHHHLHRERVGRPSKQISHAIDYKSWS